MLSTRASQSTFLKRLHAAATLLAKLQATVIEIGFAIGELQAAVNKNSPAVDQLQAGLDGLPVYIQNPSQAGSCSGRSLEAQQ